MLYRYLMLSPIDSRVCLQARPTKLRGVPQEELLQPVVEGTLPLRKWEEESLKEEAMTIVGCHAVDVIPPHSAAAPYPIDLFALLASFVSVVPSSQLLPYSQKHSNVLNGESTSPARTT